MGEHSRKYYKTLLRLGKYLLVSLIILLAMVFAILNSSFLQTKVINWASGLVKENYGITLSVDKVSFRPFNNLYLENFLMGNEDIDSLIYISEGAFSINVNPVRLFKKKITFTGVDADTVLVNAVANYTPRDDNPQVVDTTGQKGFEFLFSPCKLNLAYFDLDFRDTITHLRVDASVHDVVGEILSSNIKDQFSFKDVTLVQPNVKVKGAKINASASPYIQMILDELEDNTIGSDSVMVQNMEQSPFWAMDMDVDGVTIDDGKVEVYTFDTIRNEYTKTVDISKFNGHLDRGDSEVNFVDASNFNASFIWGDSIQFNSLEFRELLFTQEELAISGIYIHTFDSELRGDGRLVYDGTSAFKDFMNLVQVDFNIPEGSLNVADLVKVFPTLNNQEIIKENLGETVDFNFKAEGEINHLNITNWKIVNGPARLAGNGTIANITNPQARNLKVFIKEGVLPPSYLKSRLPDVQFPKGIDSIDYINLRSTISLNGNNLKLDNRIFTNLGIINNQTNYNVKNAAFNGKVQLENFEAGKFLNSPNLGKVTFSLDLNDGYSFDPKQMKANIETKFDSIEFKGYKYEDLIVNGTIQNNKFSGSVGMEKPELDFVLNGIIDFSNIAKINLLGRVNNVDLDRLNLSKENVSLSGNVDVDMVVAPVDSLSGYARLNNVVLNRNDSVDFSMNAITFDAESWGDNFKDWQLDSDILSIDIDGQFNIENILSTTYQILKNRHPQIIGYFPNLELEADTIYSNDFTLVVDVNDTQEFSHLINSKLDTIHDLNLSLTYRNRGKEYFEYYFQASAPKIQYDKVSVESMNINASGSNTDNEWIIYADSLHSGNLFVDSLQLNAKLIGDELDFKIATNSVNNILNKFYVSGGNQFLAGKDMELALDSSSFDMLGRHWNLDAGNSINFGEKKLFVNNLNFESGDRNIYVQSASEQSMIAGVNNIDIRFLDQFFPNGKFKFKGNANLTVGVENIFNLTGLEVETRIDEFYINNENFGTFNTLFYTLGLKQMANVDISFQKGNKRTLVASGEYDLFNEAQNEIPRFEFDLTANQFPILVLDFILSDIIQGTSGYANAQVSLDSDGVQPDISGEVLINGKTTIPLLGTEYQFVNSKVNLSNELIGFQNIDVVDRQNNLANVEGGIRHDHLSNFRMDTRINADKFLLLDTERSDDAVFYGRGIGKASIDITGPFNQINMDIQAETGAGSKISIPISSTISVNNTEDFFINFVSQSALNNPSDDDGGASFRIEGLNLSMDLTLTEDCEVSIILDESTGDILRSRGYSELQIELSRSGNFTMRGTYEVISGQYLFAQLNFTRKSFNINRGGTITWNGDPMNAKIDLDASYSVRTPPYNFILEYIGTSDERLSELAQNATQVELLLQLTGDLFSPDISFEMEFPELTGQIKNYVEDRLRVISDDQNEINKQVFGLLIARSFIPSVSSVVNIDGTVVNTVSEVLTNQMSFYITEYLQRSIDEVPFISNVEFNVGYNVYRNDYVVDRNTGVRSGNEFIFQPEFGFLDDRLILRTEANLQTQSALTTNTLITHDFILEYAITEDNTLKVNLYQRTEPYRTSKNSKIGLGVSYRREFDSFLDFLKGGKTES